ncbi:MAG: HPF/RaiA family ribosome-associated protein, partial [Planctomycetota bacterium]
MRLPSYRSPIRLGEDRSESVRKDNRLRRIILLFTISGKHIEITDAMKQHAQEKTSKLPRYYNSINQIEVIVDGGQGGSTCV